MAKKMSVKKLEKLMVASVVQPLYIPPGASL